MMDLSYVSLEKVIAPHYVEFDARVNPQMLIMHLEKLRLGDRQNIMRGDRKQEERIFDLFEIINSKVDIVDLLYALTKEDMDDLAEKLETTYNKLWPDKKVKRLKKPEEQKVSDRFSLKTSEPRYNSAAQSTNSEHQNIQLSGAGFPTGNFTINGNAQFSFGNKNTQSMRMDTDSQERSSLADPMCSSLQGASDCEVCIASSLRYANQTAQSTSDLHLLQAAQPQPHRHAQQINEQSEMSDEKLKSDDKLPEPETHLSSRQSTGPQEHCNPHSAQRSSLSETRVKQLLDRSLPVCRVINGENISSKRLKESTEATRLLRALAVTLKNDSVENKKTEDETSVKEICNDDTETKRLAGEILNNTMSLSRRELVGNVDVNAETRRKLFEFDCSLNEISTSEQRCSNRMSRTLAANIPRFTDSNSSFLMSLSMPSTRL